MTPPRHIVPGQAVMLTRRTHSREYTLRPDAEVRQLVAYLLAVGARQFGIGVVGGVAMSTHLHLVLIDNLGRLPDFMQWFDSLLARALNKFRGRRDSVWGGERPHVAYLADADAVVAAAAYALSNPVKDGAVARGSEWPGFRSRPNGASLPPEKVRRPDWFFSSKMPEEAELHLVVPPTHGQMSAGQFAGLLARSVGEAEERAREAHRAAGRRFGSSAGCLRVPWQRRADEPEPRGEGSTPADVIARDAQSRGFWEDLLRGFVRAYRTALALWRAGNRDVAFPAGTWRMVRIHGVLAHPPP